MADVEVVEFAGGGAGVGLDVANEARHPPLKIGHQRIDLGFVSFNDQFNPAVGEIAHVAVHSILLGDVVRGVAKSDPLNPAIEVIGPSLGHAIPMLGNHLFFKITA